MSCVFQNLKHCFCFVIQSNFRNLISFKVEVIPLEMHKTGAVVLHFKASREVLENRKLILRMNYVLSNLFISVLISETPLCSLLEFFQGFIRHELAWDQPMLVCSIRTIREHKLRESTCQLLLYSAIKWSNLLYSIQKELNVHFTFTWL